MHYKKISSESSNRLLNITYRKTNLKSKIDKSQYKIYKKYIQKFKTYY